MVPVPEERGLPLGYLYGSASLDHLLDYVASWDKQ